MSVSLQKGGNVSLSKAAPGLTQILVGLGWDVRSTDGAAFDLDASLFMLAQTGKVRSDDDFIFYNNPRSSDGSVEHTGDNQTGIGEGDDEAVKIDLSRVPADVQKMAVAVTIHDAEARRQNFGMVGSAFMRVVNQAGGQEIARYDLSEDASTETAMIFGEIYRHNTEWKFRAIGQGYKGGLGPLAASFGVDVGEPAPAAPAPPPAPPAPTPPPPRSYSPPPPPPPPAPPPAPVPSPVGQADTQPLPPLAAAAPPTSSGSVNLGKITLDKKGQSVSLEKRPSGAFGSVVINLNWSRQEPQRRGLFGGRSSGTGVDLDLGCLFQLRSGQVGGVQALGNAWGSFTSPPYILLSGDDRSGAVSEGENMRLNGDKFNEIKRVLVFAFIYEGAPNWSSTDGVVTVSVPGEGPIVVRLDNARNDRGMCAVAMIENEDGRFKVTKLAEYFKDHRDMDQAYSFGLRYKAGSKD